jgi:hypothetical protein
MIAMMNTKELQIEHPKICFGISRHNVIIPLKLNNIKDFKDGCFQYTFGVNHPNPSDYMECQQKADFNVKFVTNDSPLCDEYTNVRLTIQEAKELVTKKLRSERTSAMMKVNAIDKHLAKIDADIDELEAATHTMLSVHDQ